MAVGMYGSAIFLWIRMQKNKLVSGWGRCVEYRMRHTEFSEFVEYDKIRVRFFKSVFSGMLG